ncbi:unnamed protein product [Brachionus calyciflorus]|uniref:DNA-directed RNA polymerase III subunit n=1 Tax=Brachionus calyciflorus TaxID=104777 RepID=A0A814A9I8_9BILA|nr:unnamed protein product [Brachionus calyciflorus]
MDVIQPPPLYPPLVSRPLNLDKNEYYESELKIKKKFRNTIQESFYFIESKTGLGNNNDFEATIQRYSDRYSKSKKTDMSKFKPNWSRLPKELKYFFEDKQKVKKLKRKQIAPNLAKRKVKRIIDDDEDIDKLVNKVVKEEEEENDEETEEKEVKKTTEENEEDKEEEIEGDEDFEEDNDYVEDYFDNGEEYGDDDLGGGDDEGPVY